VLSCALPTLAASLYAQETSMPQRARVPVNSALRKSLAVLDCLIAADRPCTLAAIARTLDLPRQTVHRLLQQLSEEGLVGRALDPEAYVIGLRMHGLASAVVHARWQQAPLRAHLSRLVAAVGETCNVGVLDGDRVLYVERVECDWPLRAQLRAGDRVPVHATAIGKLLLAHLPTRARARLLGALALERYTARTITDREQLAAALGDIRQQGYSINEEENTQGLVGIAVPIRDARERVVAGLAMHAPSARTSLARARELRPIIERTAAALARELAAG
jgi:DNA-binding IclR family transcriptional regulator